VPGTPRSKQRPDAAAAAARPAEHLTPAAKRRRRAQAKTPKQPTSAAALGALASPLGLAAFLSDVA